MRLETEGRLLDFTRPLWKINRISHRTVNYGAGGFRDDCQWVLEYYGLTRQEVDGTLSIFKDAMENGLRYGDFYRIPGYRFNWRYPQPDAQPNTVLGSGIPATTYSVRVSGLDVCGNESAASLPVLVTLVSPDNAIRIRILRAPSIAPVFHAYNIYINNHLEIAGLVQPGISNGQVVGGLNTAYAIASIESLLGNGLPPIEDPVPVRWHFVRVESYVDSTSEDDEQDGLFNGQINMMTSVFNERDYPQADVVRHLGINIKVHPTDTPVVPVGGYIISSINQVIVEVNAG